MDSGSLLMILVMIAIFYFLLIRPENKRKKQAEAMRNSIKKGERITTIGGMKGRVVQVTDDSIVFETGDDRVRIEIAKWGVQSTESMEQMQARQPRGGMFGKKPDGEAPAASEPEAPAKDGDENK